MRMIPKVLAAYCSLIFCELDICSYICTGKIKITEK